MASLVLVAHADGRPTAPAVTDGAGLGDESLAVRISVVGSSRHDGGLPSRQRALSRRSRHVGSLLPRPSLVDVWLLGGDTEYGGASTDGQFSLP